MSLFKPAEQTLSHLKMGITGFAGSGKTFTGVDVAIGLVKHMKALGLPDAAKPVFFLDSEGGSDWAIPKFKAAGIQLMTAKLQAFSDLGPAIAEAEKNASVMILDSITHFWIEFKEAYERKKGRKRGLEFQDWNYLKKEWRQKFTNEFLNSSVHIIMCGRAGFEYEHYTDDAGKKQIEKSGVKMNAEKEVGFEPSLLVYMEREQDDEHRVNHVASVLKDRRMDGKTLDGKKFTNPTFADFLPHIECLALGSKHMGVDTSRTSDDSIPDDPAREHYGIRRQIVIDKIDALLLQHGASGTSTDARTKRLDLVKRNMGTVSKTEIEEVMTLEDLKAGYDKLHKELEGKPSEYGAIEPPTTPLAEIDEIPHMDVEPVKAKPAPKKVKKQQPVAQAAE